MTAQTDDTVPADCDDDPKLTAEEWQAVEVLSSRSDA